jgi:hypothetical protein
MEETGLCLFLPRRQFSSSIAPSFVEAVGGQRNATPEAKLIATAEDLLVRLERDDVAVRLNLLGQPGEQPDFVVASWVLPYVYALRGDRDWRRNPQLTGSRQVSPLAVQAYKLLETGDATIPQLKHALGREVSESAVLRAITELWQQLRIIPVIAAPGQAAKWQLLKLRFQKAIAEGASTSQVTAISVLASIYLQAVIAASMEEVELFLAPLTARSKIREVLRGLVATRQVHSLQLGHAPHFYVAGTLPEFATPPTMYASAAMPASSYFLHSYEHEDEPKEPVRQQNAPATAGRPAAATGMAGLRKTETHAPRVPASAGRSTSAGRPAARKPATAGRPSASGKTESARPHFSRSSARSSSARSSAHSRDRKPAQSAQSSRTARRTGSEARTGGARTAGARTGNGSRPALGARWTAATAKSGNGKRNGTHSAKGNGSVRASRPAGNGSSGRKASPAAAVAARGQRNGHGNGHGSVKAVGKAAKARGSRKPAMTAGAKAGNSKRYGFTAPARQRTKKRG